MAAGKTANQEKRTAAKTYRVGRIALVGRPNVGKSTLLNALLGEPIAITSHHPQTTRDPIFGVLTEKHAQFIFVDTPGLHRAKNKLGAKMNRLAKDATRNADVIVLMTDATRIKGTSLPQEEIAIVEELPSEIPVVIALNKVDKLAKKETLLPILEALVKLRFVALVPMSAKTGSGTKELLAEVRHHLPIGEKEFDDDVLTDKPVRFFATEFVREQILRQTRDEIPHGVAVSVERFEEGAKVTRIELAIHVDRESHKGILIGKGGTLLKTVGTDARARIEHMIGSKVFLGLRVRVTPRWYATEAGLSKVGYGANGESKA